MLDKSEELFQIFQKHQEKDYWGNAAIIERKKLERDQARARHELAGLEDLETFSTDEDIEQFYYYHCLSFVHEQFANVGRAVREKDTAWLSEHVRYDQHLSLELYELVTGQKVRGLSNKKLRVIFEGL
jgi:hypothetical protein